jgi:hypothetical protein
MMQPSFYVMMQDTPEPVVFSYLPSAPCHSQEVCVCAAVLLLCATLLLLQV